MSWTAPYTLDNVSITGYYISVNSGRILNTTDLSYILSSPDPINPDVCDMTNVTVSAVNGAGIGRPANTSFYYKRGMFFYFYQSTLQYCVISYIKAIHKTYCIVFKNQGVSACNKI